MNPYVLYYNLTVRQVLVPAEFVPIPKIRNGHRGYIMALVKLAEEQAQAASALEEIKADIFKFLGPECMNLPPYGNLPTFLAKKVLKALAAKGDHKKREHLQEYMGSK